MTAVAGSTGRLRALAGPRLTLVGRCLLRGLPLPRWGNLRRVRPFSASYGFDRGTPVDRYYLDAFLQSHWTLITGRVLEVLSTSPGLQFYSGNFLDGTMTGKGGWVYQFRNGFCMEPQHYPDSPNQPNFPSVVLKPGQVYHNTIIFKFLVQK